MRINKKNCTCKKNFFLHHSSFLYASMHVTNVLCLFLLPILFMVKPLIESPFWKLSTALGSDPKKKPVDKSCRVFFRVFFGVFFDVFFRVFFRVFFVQGLAIHSRGGVGVGLGGIPRDADDSCRASHYSHFNFFCWKLRDDQIMYVTSISSFFGIDFYIAAKFRHLGLKERGPSKTGVANDGVCFKNG